MAVNNLLSKFIGSWKMDGGTKTMQAEVPMSVGRMEPSPDEPRTFSVGELDQYLGELDRRLAPLEKSARDELAQFGKIPPEMPEDPVLEIARKRNVILKEAVEAYERSIEGRELTRLESMLQALTPPNMARGSTAEAMKKAVTNGVSAANREVYLKALRTVSDKLKGVRKGSLSDAVTESRAMVRRERANRAESARQAVDGEFTEIEKMRAVFEGKYQENFKRFIDYQNAGLRLGTVENAQKQVVRLKALLSGRRSTNLLTIDRTLPDDDPVLQAKIIFETFNAERERASREKRLKDSGKQHGATRRIK